MKKEFLTNIAGIQSPDADLTITINRSDLNDVMMGNVSFDDQIDRGAAILEGGREPFDELKTMLSTFTMAFELLPGTLPDAAAAGPADDNPFRQSEPPDSSGG